jgi:hypothetical protein
MNYRIQANLLFVIIRIFSQAPTAVPSTSSPTLPVSVEQMLRVIIIGCYHIELAQIHLNSSGPSVVGPCQDVVLKFVETFVFI